MITDVRVTGLWVYPIKSCQGISVNEIQIVKTGPQFDRQFMIVDSNNQFITLRTEKKLAGIHTKITNESLELSFANQNFEIHLKSESKITENVTVQDVSFLAGIESDEINQALSSYLEKPVRLVRYQSESFRDIGQYKTDLVHETTFTDVLPVLLINENSLTKLNQKLSENNLSPSTSERFRANISISGLQAYKEDQIKKITIGEITLTNPKLCSRCVIVTLDEKTGEIASKETLKYLPLHQLPKGPRIIFGQYLTPENFGLIRVGDVCKIELNEN